MNRLLTLIGIGILLVLIACNGQSENRTEDQGSQAQQPAAVKTYYYTCPMEAHIHVAGKTAGNCPECGMKLVAAQETMADSADYFGCPMPEHSHIRHETAGKCEECGMDLKPMRLKGEEMM